MKLTSLSQAIKDTKHSKVNSLFEYAVTPSPLRSYVRAGANEPQGLMDILKDNKDDVATTSIVNVTSDLTSSDIQNLQDISLLDTYISVAGSKLAYKEKPSGWQITEPKQAADFIKVYANSAFLVLSKGLPGILTLNTTVSQEFSKETTSANLHLEFLNKLFEDFNFPSTTLSQLDSILKKTVDNLSNLKLSWSEQNETLNHLILYYYFDKGNCSPQ